MSLLIARYAFLATGRIAKLAFGTRTVTPKDTQICDFDVGKIAENVIVIRTKISKKYRVSAGTGYLLPIESTKTMKNKNDNIYITIMQ